MKHPFIVYLILCLWCWAPVATLRAVPLHFLVGGNTSPSSGGGYLVDEDFEGTGVPGGTPTWTNSGGFFDISTTGLSLGGSQCLEISTNNSYALVTFDGQSTVWAYTLFRTTGFPTVDTAVFSIRNASATRLAALGVASGGTVKLYSNGAFGTASSVTLSTNTTYHVWLRYTSGGTCALYVSTSGTRPSADGSGAVYRTGTGATDTATNVRFAKGTEGSAFYYDNVLVSSGEIGSNP